MLPSGVFSVHTVYFFLVLSGPQYHQLAGLGRVFRVIEEEQPEPPPPGAPGHRLVLDVKDPAAEVCEAYALLHLWGVRWTGNK